MLSEFSSLRMMSSTIDASGMDMQQKQIQRLFRDLFDVPISKGEIIDLTFPVAANADYKFQHNLNRAPSGYTPIMLSAAGIIYSSPTVVQVPDKEIILRSSVGSLRAKIWLF